MLQAYLVILLHNHIDQRVQKYYGYLEKVGLRKQKCFRWFSKSRTRVIFASQSLKFFFASGSRSPRFVVFSFCLVFRSRIIQSLCRVYSLIKLSYKKDRNKKNKNKKSFKAYELSWKKNLTPFYARKKILSPEVWEKNWIMYLLGDC